MISPVTLNREVHEHLLSLKKEKACPLGMAIDELFYDWQRLKQKLTAWQDNATRMQEAASRG